MGADFAAFFEDVDVFGGEFGLGTGFVMFFDEVGKVQSAREAGGPCADDEDIGFELFALYGHEVAQPILSDGCAPYGSGCNLLLGLINGETGGHDISRAV